MLDKTVKALGAVGKFFQALKTNDRMGLEERIAAVSAVAAKKTRQYVELLEKGGLRQTQKGKWEGEISNLWSQASREIGKFDRKLGEECSIKAYGWGTGVWDDPAFSTVPRRVEEVYADALKLIAEYTTILKH